MHILFDIGGTKMRVAGSKDLASFGDPKIVHTPKDYDEGVTLLKDTIKEISQGGKIESIAGGIAGPFSGRKAVLVGSPNLSGWIGKPLKADLENEFGAPVFIENDSAVVALGEAHFGAGRGYEIMSYITVSTGVGGARIVGGRIDEKAVGFEPGHQIIDADQSMCGECDGNYLGNYISGKGLEKRFGMPPVEIKDEKVWNDELPKYLAYGLNNTIVHWSPDVIVLGGSMMIGDPAISIDKTKAYLKEMLKIFPELPEIKKAELGDVGGLYGAMAYARQKIGEESVV